MPLLPVEGAVGLPVVALELEGGQHLVTHHAAEALGVPNRVEGIDAPARDGLPTPCARRRQPLGVASGAEEMALELLEVATSEVRTTLLTPVVLGVHVLPVNCEELPSDRLLTLCTNLRGGGGRATVEAVALASEAEGVPPRTLR
eukprot:TRINITY_DN4887_c0_g1_i3.p2 TRINITY_DN4887_c0_g1~~TRINITY_DN4887_c0_g1_i3.p2  ORF type:complete len:145 (-),score=21.14 TRINITY_DN4887_c0_g1_i3:15-449(-)